MKAHPCVTGMDAVRLGDETCFPCEKHDEFPTLIVQVGIHHHQMIHVMT